MFRWQSLARRARAGTSVALLAIVVAMPQIEAPPRAHAQPRFAVVTEVPLRTPPTPPPPAPAPDASSQDYVEFEDGHTGEIVRIPRSEIAEETAVVADPLPQRPDGSAVPNQQPRRWARGASRCSRYGRRRYCDGPLRVPEPHGPEAAVARRLGLGSHTAGGRALEHEPQAAWMAEVRRYRPSNRLQWPVDGGHVVRGLLPARRTRVVTRTSRGRRVRFRVKPAHRGVDIGARPGTFALGIDHGLVLYSRNEMRGYGNVVIVLHANGAISLYAHLRAAWVFPGQHIERGQIVGEIGETGLARGPHLHFEWRRNGRPLDPIPHFVNRPRGQSIAPEVVGEVLPPEQLPIPPDLTEIELAPEGEDPLTDPNGPGHEPVDGIAPDEEELDGEEPEDL